MPEPDLQLAASAIETASAIVRQATSKLAETGSVDADQVLAYETRSADNRDPHWTISRRIRTI